MKQTYDIFLQIEPIRINELKQTGHELHITFQRSIFGIKAITFKALHLHYESTSSGNSLRIKLKNHICEV